MSKGKFSYPMFDGSLPLPNNLVIAPTGGAQLRFTPNTGSAYDIRNNTSELLFVNFTAGNYNACMTNTGLALYSGSGVITPTHSLTLPSVATGIATYLTSTQTTNYERILEYQASSVYNIESQAAGTGVARPIKIGGATSKITVQPNGVLLPVQATTAAAPTYVLGGMYFDTTLNKLRIGGASAWETVTSV
jgi:hypothetical protein